MQSNEHAELASLNLVVRSFFFYLYFCCLFCCLFLVGLYESRPRGTCPLFADRPRARPQVTFARGSPSSRPDSTPARPTRIHVCVGVIQNSPGSIDIPCSSRVLSSSWVVGLISTLRESGGSSGRRLPSHDGNAKSAGCLVCKHPKEIGRWQKGDVLVNFFRSSYTVDQCEYIVPSEKEINRRKEKHISPNASSISSFFFLRKKTIVDYSTSRSRSSLDAKLNGFLNDLRMRIVCATCIAFTPSSIPVGSKRNENMLRGSRTSGRLPTVRGLVS